MYYNQLPFAIPQDWLPLDTITCNHQLLRCIILCHHLWVGYEPKIHKFEPWELWVVSINIPSTLDVVVVCITVGAPKMSSF